MLKSWICIIKRNWMFMVLKIIFSMMHCDVDLNDSTIMQTDAAVCFPPCGWTYCKHWKPVSLANKPAFNAFQRYSNLKGAASLSLKPILCCVDTEMLLQHRSVSRVLSDDRNTEVWSESGRIRKEDRLFSPLTVYYQHVSHVSPQSWLVNVKHYYEIKLIWGASIP